MNTLLLYAITLVYLLVTLYLGYRGWKTTKDSEGYMLAGRKAHPYIMAMSYGATFISTSAIVGFGGTAGLFGMGLLWLTLLNIFVGVFLAFIVYGKRTRKMGHNLGAMTFPELLGKRFDSKFVQCFSGLVIFFGMPMYASVVLIGAARFLETTLNIKFDLALLIYTIIIAVYVMGRAEGGDVHRCPAGNYNVHRNGHTPGNDLRSSGWNNCRSSGSDEHGFNGAAKSGRPRPHGLDFDAYLRQRMVVDDGINDRHGRWNRCIGHASTGDQVHDRQVQQGA
jgi:hypothetical protein